MPDIGWEYMVADEGSQQAEELENWLTSHGDAGWELVATFEHTYRNSADDTTSSTRRWIFKRYVSV